MGVVSGIVLYLVIWFMTFLTILPLRIQTQGDLGQIVPGTHAGSPEHHHLKKKFVIVTAIATVLWAIIAAIILSGAITVDDIDVFRPKGPLGESAGQ